MGLKHLLAFFGYRIQRLSTPMRSLEWGFRDIAKRFDIRTVIDVGVADGTPELYRAFKGKSFVLVEADPCYRTRLYQLADKLGDSTIVYPIAAGDKEGTAIFYSTSSKNGAYSSLHAKYKESNPISVEMKRLDSLHLTNNPFGQLLLKIDVEGAEMDVLRGCEGILPRCGAIVVECSIVPKYRGGPVFSDVVTFLKSHGFEIYDLLAGSAKKGRLSQLDAVFVQERHI